MQKKKTAEKIKDFILRILNRKQYLAVVIILCTIFSVIFNKIYLGIAIGLAISIVLGIIE